VKAYCPLSSVVVDTVCAGEDESFNVTVPFISGVIGEPLAAVPLIALPDLTVSTHANDALPAAFIALIVYVVCDAAAVGVPASTPLVLLSDSPAGRVGLTE
jgi:hypothetical protein